MSLDRIKFLAGVVTESSKYAEPKANHEKKSFSSDEAHAKGHDVKDKPTMKMEKPKTSEKTGDQSGDHTKKPGGKVVAKDIDTKGHYKKGTKGNTSEPKANHEKKLGGKAIKEMAQTIAESGDVEGAMRDLLAALEEQGVQL